MANDTTMPGMELLTADGAMGQCNRLEKEILAILFEFRPVMTNRMKLDATKRIAQLIKPITEQKDNNAKIY